MTALFFASGIDIDKAMTVFNLIISVMRKIILAMSALALLVGMTACKSNEAQSVLNAERQEKEFLRDAIRHRSPDVQRVDLIGNTVV